LSIAALPNLLSVVKKSMATTSFTIKDQDIATAFAISGEEISPLLKRSRLSIIFISATRTSRLRLQKRKERRSKKKNASFGEEITSYGDYVIVAKVRARTRTYVIQRSLAKALAEEYDSPPKTKLSSCVGGYCR
jgi:hypothetical protein